jgi:hypothetical protein
MSSGCHDSSPDTLSRGEMHEDPPHYPEHLEAAYQRMRHLHDQLQQGISTVNWAPVGAEAHSADIPADAIEELGDLAHWLPELAAATDLQEADWLESRAIAEELKQLLHPLLRLASAERQSQLQPLASEIRQPLDRLGVVAQENRRLIKEFTMGLGEAERSGVADRDEENPDSLNNKNNEKMPATSDKNSDIQSMEKQ